MTPDLATTPALLAQLRTGRHAVPTDDVVLRVEGPGAVACLQGIVTNELDRVTVPSLRYAAVLTPKGMIVTPLWLRRDAVGVWLVVPRRGAAALQAILSRSFPPRLAKVTDHSESVTCWRLFGSLTEGDAPLHPALPDGRAPFSAMVIGPRETTGDALRDAGWQGGTPALARLAEVLGGWPALGHEIDGKTLPQEVGFDALEGVKHDKGCYVGQETVARIHFRGHPNRTLRALVGSGPPPDDGGIHAGDRDVGSIATLVTGDDWWLATAKIRREVDTGAAVEVGGRRVEVTEFPIDHARLGA